MGGWVLKGRNLRARPRTGPEGLGFAAVSRCVSQSPRQLGDRG